MGLLAGTPWDRPPHCPRCDFPESDCRCPPPPIRIALERRKGGKTVTVLRGFDPRKTDLADLLVRLKDACGCGGTRDEDDVVLQGDQTARLPDILGQWGLRVHNPARKP